MKIQLDTLEKMPLAMDSYGDKITGLLKLGSHLRDQPFAVVEKKLFGGGGEVFTPDRYISFKANKGFSKLKEQNTLNYSDVTSFEPGNGSTGLDWDFIGARGKFTIGLVYYGTVKGIAARDIFWYQLEEFPIRSRAFYDLLSRVVPRTGLTGELKSASVKRTLENAMGFFQGTLSAEDIGFDLNPGNAQYPEFHALQRAFSYFLAGTTMAVDSTVEAYLDIFRSLDHIYSGILQKLMAEYNTKLGNIFNREQKIYEADEKFQRLSSIWYLRQMASLHFASKHLPTEEIRHWSVKVLKPRARRGSSSNRATVEIKLPAPEEYEEAMASLEA